MCRWRVETGAPLRGWGAGLMTTMIAAWIALLRAGVWACALRRGTLPALRGLPVLALVWMLAWLLVPLPASAAPRTAAPSESTASVPSAPRAIWVWEDDSYALLEQGALVPAALRFFRQQGIGTVYLYADAHQGRNLLVSQPQRYAQLITQLHRAGLQVHALLGSWPLQTHRYILPAMRPQALQMVQRVLDYNRDAPPAARFDGINLDIEPHVLDDWAERREHYLQLFLQLSEAWMALKRASGQTLQIGPALVFWLDGIEVLHGGRRRPASEHMQDIYDHVVLMNYRNRADGPDGLLAHAERELAYGQRIGKPVLLGVETAPNEIAKLTFDGLTPVRMSQVLGEVERALAGQPAFGGFVIHHYGSYRRWLERTR